MANDFYTRAINSNNEKDIENLFRAEIYNLYKKHNGIIHSACNTDGILVARKLDVVALLEFKWKYNFKSKQDIVKVLIQCLYYLHNLEKANEIAPKVIFVGDDDECFVIKRSVMDKYLSRSDIDWSLAPSTACSHITNVELVDKMLNDKMLNPYIFDITKDFNIGVVFDKINNLCKDFDTFIKINNKNVDKCYKDFVNKVLSSKNELSSKEKVALFYNIITNRENYYIKPSSNNTLVTPIGELKIKGNQFEAFFSYYEGEYSPSEKRELTSTMDRLKDDEERREEGAFFTPTAWCNELARNTKNVFGEDVFERMLVFDSCSGSGNLTRDIKCNNLFVSSLVQEELDAQDNLKINRNATKFQFDFLNDDLEKLPSNLVEQLEAGVEVLIYINPPYATSANGKNDDNKKGGVAKTKTNINMLDDGMGKSAQQLYAQFLFRIVKLKELYTKSKFHISLLSPSLFLCGGSFDKFRTLFFDNFKYEYGYMFNASHFHGTADTWGILNTIWSDGKTTENEFLIDIKDTDSYNQVIDIEQKTLYNIDGLKGADKWVREEIKGLKTFDVPQLSSGVGIKQNGRGTLVENAIGYFYNNSNSVMKNAQNVGMFSGAFSGGNGLSITKENFLKCTALFTARKSVQTNWLTDKDEYLTPNENHEVYKQFQNDSLVYSLFHSISNQSSLRNIEYKGKLYDIKNEFFFLSKQEMMDLAEKHNYDEVYFDAEHDSERYVYTLLQNIELSEDTAKLLNMAKDIMRNSFRFRKTVQNNCLITKGKSSTEIINLHLNAWDAGFYQIRKMLKEMKYMTEELKDFQEQYKLVESRLNKQVYELGFLKR